MNIMRSGDGGGGRVRGERDQKEYYRELQEKAGQNHDKDYISKRRQK